MRIAVLGVALTLSSAGHLLAAQQPTAVTAPEDTSAVAKLIVRFDAVESVATRVAAADDLAAMGQRAISALPSLVAAYGEDLRDLNPAIDHALWSIDSSGRAVMPFLIKVVEQPRFSNQRFAVMMYLQEIGAAGASAAPTLVTVMLDSPKRTTFLELMVLGSIGVDSVPPALASAAIDTFYSRAARNGDPEIRQYAVRALARFGAKAVSKLSALAASPDQRIAVLSLQHLSRIMGDSPDSIGTSAVFAELANPHVSVRDAAQAAATGLGPSVLPRLDSLAEHAARPARKAAALAAKDMRVGLGIPVTGRCYRLAPLNWAPLASTDRKGRGFAVPSEIRFTLLASLWGQWRDSWFKQVVATNRAREVSRGPGSWGPVKKRADSIDVVWSDGFSGVGVRLAIKGDTLHGLARTFVDVEPAVDDTATITAIRVPCGASAAH